MALDNLLEVYDENGVKQDYDILADDVKFSPDGKDLPTKLAEIGDEISHQVTEIVFNGETHNANGGRVDIGSQMQPDWNESSTLYPTYIRNKPNVVTGIKMGENSGTYTPNDGVVTLPESSQVTFDTAMSDTSENGVQNKVVKAYVDAVSQRIDTLIGSGNVQGAIDTFNEVVAFLNGINSSDTLAAKLATLVPQTRTINGKALSNNVTIGMSDIQGLVDAINNAGSGAVSVSTNQDGTFTIHVGETDYTINLNHTHENMAKLVVCEESDLPSTLDPATIYAQVDDAADPTEIQSLWVAGLEFVGGGGEPEPKLRFPSPNSQINVDDLISGGLFIRGSNLSQPLLVTVTGDFTINGGSTATVQATNANAGTTLTLACTTQSYNATGSLVITSSEGINTSCSLIANVPNYESITAAVFRGAQWVNMGFSVGPNTSFEWDVKFEEDSQHAGSNPTFFSCNSDRPYLFQANFDSSAISSMLFWVGSDSVRKSGFSLGRGIFIYSNQNCSYRGLSFSPSEVTFTASDFSLGISRISNDIFNRLAMIVFGLKVYENNVLTHDFVPKKFGSVVGFYDNVTSAFVSSQTSTELEEYNS